MNTPRWQDLFKDLRRRKPDTERMHIQVHGTDLAHLPFAGKLKWLIELPIAWSWFLTWSPGMIPNQYMDSNIWPIPASLSSSAAGPPSMASGPPSMAASPAARSTFSSAPLPTGTPPSSSTLPTTTSKAASLAPSPLFSQPASGPLSTQPHYRALDRVASSEVQQLSDFLHEDADMAQQVPTLVQEVAQQCTPAQFLQSILQRTWFDPSRQTSRRTMAQPSWTRQLQSPSMPIVVVAQPDEESDTSVAASDWSPPDGYQSLTSTQRNADATWMPRMMPMIS